MRTRHFLQIPDRIERLEELAYNLKWSWDYRARLLFKRLDPDVWKNTQHNPVKLLQTIDSTRLIASSRDPDFLREYDVTMKSLDRAMRRADKWFPREFPDLAKQPIAYFSAEFGIHTSLPIYSGGLGILAGDHCKESSDLGLPLAGVGFVYPQGYFHQRITSEGRQEASYERFDFGASPMQPVITRHSEGGLLALNLNRRVIYIEVWRVRLGSVSIYLMATDVEENDPWDRELSARLYGGDQETRIRQEMVLGIGGVRMLERLGIRPTVFHANEGHASFLMLERIRSMVQGGMSFDEAADFVRSTTIFTTHTPVPAGHDVFSFHL